MTTWKFIGCSINDVPPEIFHNDQLTAKEIKQIIDNVDIIDGEIEAVTVDAITALLLDNGIFPLKIHPDDGSDNTISRLKKFKSKIIANRKKTS